LIYPQGLIHPQISQIYTDKDIRGAKAFGRRAETELKSQDRFLVFNLRKSAKSADMNSSVNGMNRTDARQPCLPRLQPLIPS
jgi:hypothetical protein